MVPNGSTSQTSTFPHLPILRAHGSRFEKCLAKALSPAGHTFSSFLSDLGQLRSTEDEPRRRNFRSHILHDTDDEEDDNDNDNDSGCKMESATIGLLQAKFDAKGQSNDPLLLVVVT